MGWLNTVYSGRPSENHRIRTMQTGEIMLYFNKGMAEPVVTPHQ